MKGYVIQEDTLDIIDEIIGSTKEEIEQIFDEMGLTEDYSVIYSIESEGSENE